jgi:hypothetical protein
VATVHGEESAWLRLLVAKRTAALGAYGVILVATVTGLAAYDARVAAALLVAGIVFACGRGGLIDRRVHATQGIAGERETAKVLALLPASFTVLNDFGFPRFNVDHVVVGPTGVWAIETKSQAGFVEERDDSVWLNGRPMYRDPLRQARGEAAAIAELLERETGKRHWVEALVCFPNATVTANANRGEARVVARGRLLMRLRLSPASLARDERDHIAEVLVAAKGRAANGARSSASRGARCPSPSCAGPSERQARTGW